MNEKTECEFNTKLILESLACGDPYLRKNFIGASDAPIIMGVSPWRTVKQLYSEKIGTEAPQKETYPMTRGNELEALAREMFEKITGYWVMPRRLFHPIYEWMMASLDGMDATEKVVVEIKCPGKKSHAQAKNGKVPEIYYPQLQHQMIVADLKKMYYFSYYGGSHYLFTVERDDEYCEKLIEKESKFWDCIKNMTEPGDDF